MGGPSDQLKTFVAFPQGALRLPAGLLQGGLSLSPAIRFAEDPHLLRQRVDHLLLLLSITKPPVADPKNSNHQIPAVDRHAKEALELRMSHEESSSPKILNHLME